MQGHLAPRGHALGCGSGIDVVSSHRPHPSAPPPALSCTHACRTARPTLAMRRWGTAPPGWGWGACPTGPCTAGSTSRWVGGCPSLPTPPRHPPFSLPCLPPPPTPPPAGLPPRPGRLCRPPLLLRPAVQLRHPILGQPQGGAGTAASPRGELLSAASMACAIPAPACLPGWLPPTLSHPPFSRQAPHALHIPTSTPHLTPPIRLMQMALEPPPTPPPHPPTAGRRLQAQ